MGVLTFLSKGVRTEEVVWGKIVSVSLNTLSLRVPTSAEAIQEKDSLNLGRYKTMIWQVTKSESWSKKNDKIQKRNREV